MNAATYKLFPGEILTEFFLMQAFDLGEYKSADCAAHKLNLVVKRAIGSQRAISDALVRGRKIVEFINRSPAAREELRNVQMEENLPEHCLIQVEYSAQFSLLKRCKY
ncbi:MAG: hypothetical protein GY820_22125 [Gammaproteobacteria bacterium]|nr:hypothetical protein [Gammaproteobacteria bacterium]